MSARPDLYPFEANLHYFDSLVREAQRTLIAQIEAAIRSGDLNTAARRQAQLAAVNQTLTQLALTANPLASRMVQEAWQQGADRALKQIEALPIDTVETPGAFFGVSQEAVEAMQRSLTQRLDAATQTLGRRVEDVYAREQRRAALNAILGAEGSPERSAAQLVKRLMNDRQVKRAIKEGGTGFVDSAGRQWKLDTYANMATRTVTREAVVQGAVARMASHGISIGRISTHPNACELCQPFQGMLVALGPNAPAEWKGEAVADTGELPPFHPNCAHSVEPVACTIQSLREELELEPVGA